MVRRLVDDVVGAFGKEAIPSQGIAKRRETEKEKRDHSSPDKLSIVAATKPSSVGPIVQVITNLYSCCLRVAD